MSTDVIEIAPESIINEQTEEVTAVKSSSKKRIWLAVIISVGFLFITASISLTVLYFNYMKEVQYYETHFFPNTIINGFDAGHKTVDDVVDLIFAQSQNYQLKILDQDGIVAGVIKAEDIGYIIDITADVEEILFNQDEQRWFFDYMEPTSHIITYEFEFNHNLLRNLLLSFDVFNRSKMKMPENAFISEYNEEIKGYGIVAEQRGSTVNFTKAFELIILEIYNRANYFNLEEEGCYVRALITSDNPRLIDRKTRLNRFTHTRITYDWNGSEVILDGDLIHQWIIEEDGEFFIDEEQVREFVNFHARENDTYGKTWTFVTTAGVSRRLPGGGFGWRTDRREETAELMELIPNSVVMEREPIYWLRSYHKGQDSISDSYVEIDLGNQRLYLYIEGEKILDSDLVSGNVSKGFTTPEGVFGITYRERNAVLRGATYTTPVRWWMPFNGNIGMHDAGWRRSFGGEIYLTDGSHGCINLPPRVAKEIFEYMKPGFPVVCYY